MAKDEARRVSPELGATGLNWVAGGTIQEEIHQNLTGRQAIMVYRDMSDNDPVVSSILYAIDMLVRQVEWHVEQDEASEEDVEFLESCMQDMSHSWADFISETVSMLRYGFSYHEIVYKIRRGRQKENGPMPSSRFDDGKVGWRKLPIRSQDTLDHWDFDPDNGALQGMTQKAPPLYRDQMIPIQKGLLFRTTSYKNNPEGRSLLRGAYRPWFFKKRIEEIEGTGIERDMAGFPVMKVPAAYLSDGATNDEKTIVQAMQTIGKNLRRDKQEYLVWPQAYDEQGNSLFEIELMSASGSRSFDTSAIIQRYDQRIAMTVLADFILLGHDKVGSFALSSDKTDLFAVALGTVLDVIQDTLNRFAVPRLWEMNGMKIEQMPKIVHGDIEDPDLTALGSFLQALNGLGMPLFPDDDLEKYVRESAHLPMRSEETKREQEEAKQQGMPGQEGGGEPQEEDDGTIRFSAGPDAGSGNAGPGGSQPAAPPPGGGNPQGGPGSTG